MTLTRPQKFEQKKKKRSGPRYDPEDGRKCIFWQKYVLPARDDNVTIEMSLHNEESRGGKKFRRRFRIPYALFLKIFTNIEDEGYYTQGKRMHLFVDAMLPKYAKLIPLKALLLPRILRILGSNLAIVLPFVVPAKKDKFCVRQ